MYLIDLSFILLRSECAALFFFLLAQRFCLKEVENSQCVFFTERAVLAVTFLMLLSRDHELISPS